ncbi:MAG: hypothetical protein JXB36_08770 [Gammaproteobacteria bacterium]|nr:hypothetical protein [Gammaproteobacteria bacterium]
MVKAVLFCSLLANAAFALLIARDAPSRYDSWQRIELGSVSGSGEASRSPKPGAPRAARREGPDASAGEYYAALLSLGLDDEEAKTLVLAKLEREARSALDPPADTYWREGPESRIDHALAALEAEQGVRQKLLRAFGDGAAGEPVFTRLFRPLDPYLRFLSSEEQLAVRRARLEAQRAAAAVGPVSDAVQTRRGAAPAAGPGPDFSAALRPSSLLEYELRESPLASRLRAATDALSEQEFRDAFVLLRSMQSGGSLRDHLDMRAELERLLGARAFARLWAGRDPTFSAVAEVARRRGWSEQTTMQAYELLVRLDEQMLGMIEASGNDPAAVSDRLRELEADASARLASVVGEDGAQALLRSRATQSIPADEAGIPLGRANRAR